MPSLDPSRPTLRPGHGVALCAMALLTIGVLMVNSASMQVDAEQPMTMMSILGSRTAAYAGLAMLAMALCALVPVRRLLPAGLASTGATAPEGEPAGPEGRVLSGAWLASIVREYRAMWPLWAGAAAIVGVLALVYVPGIERPKNGSHRWISLHVPGLESIQPSEIAKWAMVVLLAWYGARYAHRMRSFWLGLVPGLIAAGAIAGFIVVEDLGTGALLGATAAIVLLASGARFWHMLLLAPAPIMGAVLAIVSNPYRLHRIESFLNPYLDPQGKGFHMIQSMTAVAGGQVFGRGMGHGLQKFGYLPEDTTDFLFAVVCEELGIAGAALVIGLLGLLVWCLWLIVRHERVMAIKLLGLGVMATIGIQALINLAVVTGMGPTKGIALPLLSSGGTGWILIAAMLGLLIGADRAQGVQGVRLLSGIGGGGRDSGGGERGGETAMAMGVLGAMVATPALAVPPVATAASGQQVSRADEQRADAGEFAPAMVGASSELPPPLPPPLPPVIPTVEPMPVLEVSPGEGAVADGFLFDVSKPKPESKVVVTDAGKGWPAAS